MIKVRYSKKEKDFVIEYDQQCNGNLVNDYVCNNSFIIELQNRGFDITTLSFSIKKIKRT